MSQWPAAKPRRVLRALLKIGWSEKRRSGSHLTLLHADYPPYTFAFHEDEEIGPVMMAKIAKHTGLKPTDL